MPILTAKHITKSFPQGSRIIHAVSDISLTFEAGVFSVIWGSSGSGKSSLLSILAGLDRPTKGEVYLSEKRIDLLKEDELAQIRQTEIGFIFQSFHLVPALTALENVMLPLQLQKIPDAKSRAQALLETVGLGDRLDNFSTQLSGGEQQRVAIARALITKPKILFADEPTGNLDGENSAQILSLLLDLQKKESTTLILVTHESSIAEKAERIITLEDGMITDDRLQTSANTKPR